MRAKSGNATTPPTPAARLDFRNRRREESLLMDTFVWQIHAGCENVTTMVV